LLLRARLGLAHPTGLNTLRDGKVLADYRFAFTRLQIFLDIFAADLQSLAPADAKKNRGCRLALL